MQAQALSAAQLSLGVRVAGCTPRAVEHALWRQRTLVKTWTLRGTLHVLPAEDLLLSCHALSASQEKRMERWLAGERTLPPSSFALMQPKLREITADEH